MSENNASENVGHLVQGTKDLNADIAFLSDLGFRLDHIYPTDDPKVGILSGHNFSIRLDVSEKLNPAIIYLLTDDPEQLGGVGNSLLAPNGTRINILEKTYHLIQPTTKHKFEVRKLKDGEPWMIGRAGMQYRDLIPDRLGGSIIASHIRIPKGGPVPDVVHYHTIGFQLIFCYRGWVKLVYEDQGPPFQLNAGDCVIQPPEIRHQVLEASDHLEVIEIGVPSDHMTTIDHEMKLPTQTYRPDRIFQDQKFCRHQVKDAVWQPSRIVGLEQRDSGIYNATKGVASVVVMRPSSTGVSTKSQHNSDILFSFVMEGSFNLSADGYGLERVHAGEAFVVPPSFEYEISEVTDDFELLEVALPGIYTEAPV